MEATKKDGRGRKPLTEEQKAANLLARKEARKEKRQIKKTMSVEEFFSIEENNLLAEIKQLKKEIKKVTKLSSKEVEKLKYELQSILDSVDVIIVEAIEKEKEAKKKELTAKKEALKKELEKLELEEKEL